MTRPAYPCTQCNDLFFVYRDYEKHMKDEHHQIKIWKCKKCLQSFRGVDAFDRHIEYEHNGRPLYSMGLAISQAARELKELEKELEEVKQDV